MYLVFNRELESGCQKPVGSCGPEFSKGFGGTTAPGFREVNSHTKVVHQVQDDLYHQKKFNYLDQSRIRSEQGRMKFYVFLFLAFFTCFDQFSTCLNICSHFYSIFHIFLACFHFIFVFFLKNVTIFGENTSNTTWLIKLCFLGRIYPNS